MEKIKLGQESKKIEICKRIFLMGDIKKYHLSYFRSRHFVGVFGCVCGAEQSFSSAGKLFQIKGGRGFVIVTTGHVTYVAAQPSLFDV